MRTSLVSTSSKPKDPPVTQSQKTYLSASCICRMLPFVDVIRPKFVPESDVFGSPHTGWFMILNASARKLQIVSFSDVEVLMR